MPGSYRFLGIITRTPEVLDDQVKQSFLRRVYGAFDGPRPCQWNRPSPRDGGVTLARLAVPSVQSY